MGIGQDKYSLRFLCISISGNIAQEISFLDHHFQLRESFLRTTSNSLLVAGLRQFFLVRISRSNTKSPHQETDGFQIKNPTNVTIKFA